MTLLFMASILDDDVDDERSHQKGEMTLGASQSATKSGSWIAGGR